MRRAPFRSIVRPATVLVLTATAVLTACNSGEGNSGEAYCGTIETNLAGLASPAIATVDDIDLTLELYRSIAARAPAAVEPEWQQLVLNLETASTVDPNDPVSLQLAADTARATTKAAVRVQEYTSQTCGLQIGQVPAVTLPPTTLAAG